MHNTQNKSDIDSEFNQVNGIIAHGVDEFESLQQEIALIHDIAHAKTLEEVLNIILKALNKKYGFNMSAGQIVDEENKILKFLTFFTTEEVDDEIRKKVSVDVPLDYRLSVSASVAISKRWIYASADRIDALSEIPEVDRNSLELLGIKENLILPVVDRDKTIAVIHLGAIGKRLYLTKEKCQEIYRFIGGLAPNVLIIKNKFEQEYIKQEQQKTLDIIHRISKTINLEEILDIIGEEIGQLDSIDGYTINLLDKEKNILTCSKVSLPGNFKAIERTFHHFNYSLGPDDENTPVINEKKVVSIDTQNISRFSESARSRFKAWRMRHMITIPITNIEDVNADVVGAITVFNNTGKICHKSIDTLCQKMVMFFDPIENSIKYSKLKAKEKLVETGIAERAKFLSFVNEVNNLSSVDKIYEKISEEFLRRYPFDMVSILMKKDGRLHGVSSYTKDERFKLKSEEWKKIIKEKPFDISYEGGSYSMCFLNDQNLYFPDVPQIQNLPMNRNDKVMLDQIGGFKSIIHLPINKDNKPIGVISISSFDSFVTLSREDINYLEMLSSFIGTSIVNAGLYSTIADQKNEIEETLSELKSTQDKLVETEKKKNEALVIAMQAAEASAEAKSSFLANMSHEIRTPMNAIIGLTELALQREMTPKMRDYLGKINTSSQTLLGIINDILDFSKIEAGKLSIEETEFNLYEVIDHISDIFSTRIVDKNISMIINPSPKIPRLLIGDPLRLSQVLINIINNAIKFTNEGEIQVSIDISSLEGDQVVLEFQVADTGIGIPPEVIPLLFTPFTQADGSTTRKFGGTGLGLSICKHLVELMDGEINVESHLGFGSKFSFTAGLKVANLSCVGLYNSMGLIPEDVTNKNILIAADNIHESNYLFEILKNHRVKAERVHDFSSVVHELSKENRYDLLLIDSNLLNQSFTQRIAELHLLYSGKIVLLSPFGFDNSIDKSSLQYINNIITKPIKISDLINCICKNLLSGHEYTPIYKSSINDEKAYDELEIIEKVRGIRILLTDDNVINQQVGRELLERVGAVVDVADDGKQAIAKALQNQYDIIFMDLHMPEIGGLEATQILRSMQSTKDMPIIAMTANAMQGDRDNCINGGMDDYISKPVMTKDLYELLLKWDPREHPESAPSTLEVVHEHIGYDKQCDEHQEQEELVAEAKELSVIDVEKTLKLLADNESLFLEICNLFINDYSDSMDRLKTYVQNSDFGLAYRFCHSLKGVASTISAESFYKICCKLEQAFEEEDDVRVDSLFPELEQQFGYFLKDVEKIVS